MGRDRAEYARKKKRPPFCLLEKDLLLHKKFKALSSSAKVAFLYTKAKFNGANLENICLSYTSMRDVMAPATLAKAFRELEKAGLIKFVRHGGLRTGLGTNCNIIAISEWKEIRDTWGKG